MVANAKFHSGRGLRWMRILAGILICSFGWLGFVLLAEVALPVSVYEQWLPFIGVGLSIVAAIVTWIVVRKSSTRSAVVLSVVAVLGACVWLSLFALGRPGQQVSFSPAPTASSAAPPP